MRNEIRDLLISLFEQWQWRSQEEGLGSKGNNGGKRHVCHCCSQQR